jgi:hypothetical protein
MILSVGEVQRTVILSDTKNELRLKKEAKLEVLCTMSVCGYREQLKEHEYATYSPVVSTERVC